MSTETDALIPWHVKPQAYTSCRYGIQETSLVWRWKDELGREMCYRDADPIEVAEFGTARLQYLPSHRIPQAVEPASIFASRRLTEAELLDSRLFDRRLFDHQYYEALRHKASSP